MIPLVMLLLKDVQIQHHLILKEINTSGKPYVIYKTPKGFDLFTNFSKKIILSRNNIANFLKKNNSNKKKLKKTDLHIGFFGYELLNNLININLPKQKSNNFPKGIFYKPENLISLNKILVPLLFIVILFSFL
jgi:para-aminobenzoate synthetase component 1